MSDTVQLTRRERRRPKRPRVSFVQVMGELLVTAGVVALLFVVWQMWVGDIIIGNQKQAEAAELSASWLEQTETPSTPTEPGTNIPVRDQPAHGEKFGVMFIPRFGADWKFTITGGTTRKDILDLGEIGHYADTAMPGGMGNTVYAAHRWTSGQPFDPIDRLVVGDAIVIQTPDGWYTYRFRTHEYVQDTQVDVLLPVPQKTGVAPDERYLTLTSCAPKLNMLERIIAYAVFEEYIPLADGPPAALTEGVAS